MIATTKTTSKKNTEQHDTSKCNQQNGKKAIVEQWKSIVSDFEKFKMRADFRCMCFARCRHACVMIVLLSNNVQMWKLNSSVLYCAVQKKFTFSFARYHISMRTSDYRNINCFLLLLHFFYRCKDNVVYSSLFLFIFLQCFAIFSRRIR